MLKQSTNGMRKVLAVLLVGLFVVSLTAVAASADDPPGGHFGGHAGHFGGHAGHFGGHGGHGCYGGYGGYYGGLGYGYGAGCYVVNGALVCPTYGYPYI